MASCIFYHAIYAYVFQAISTCLAFVTKTLHAFFISHIITWAECIVPPHIYSVNRTSYEAPHCTVKIETACYYCMNLKVAF
jgi:hypothetical protein